MDRQNKFIAALFADSSYVDMELFPPDENEPSETATFRLSKALANELKAISRQTGKSKSRVIVRLLEIGIAKYKDGQSKKK